MRTEDIPNAPLSPWVPTTDQELLAALGKLGEELNELSGCLFRTIIQGGLDEQDPTDGRSNKAHIIDEIADTYVMLDLLVMHLNLRNFDLRPRVEAKRKYQLKWRTWLHEHLVTQAEHLQAKGMGEPEATAHPPLKDPAPGEEQSPTT